MTGTSGESRKSAQTGPLGLNRRYVQANAPAATSNAYSSRMRRWFGVVIGSVTMKKVNKSSAPLESWFCRTGNGWPSQSSRPTSSPT